MKKILLLILVASSFLSADIFDDLKKKKIDTFYYLGNMYPIDETCTRLDLKKFIIIQENLIKNKKSKKFYLDLCPPFEKLYNLNKRASLPDSKKILISGKFYELLEDYKDSVYINFYAYIFLNKNNYGFSSVKFKQFELMRDDYSKYMNVYSSRKVLNQKSNKKENYFEKIYKEGKPLLKSKFNDVYLAVSNDITTYIKKNKPEEYLEFLLFRLEENKKRDLDNKFLYMELANLKFEQTYLNSDFNSNLIERIIIKSYEAGKLDSQMKLYIKLDVRNHYLNLAKTYPKYINNVNEYDLLLKEIDFADKADETISKKYYYLAKLRALIYEKYIYLKNNEKIRDKLIKNFERVLLNEPDFREKRKISTKIEELKKNTFLE